MTDTSPPSTYRVLVTGSRDWDDPERVRFELNSIYDALISPGQTMTVVHGACPTGADRHAHQWCADRQRFGGPVIEEQHPATWLTHSRAAGPLRNKHMVDLGADLCLAFIRAGSRGATHCARLAEAADIPIRRYTA
ncbi:SLOG family protein [Streptomyces cinnamoneus]|uniref:SLOG family protein n=1 Tax=Streptomyces cinnamoneus TaxID=53446 RepID=UPI0033F879D1